MFELKPLIPKTEQALIVDVKPRTGYDSKQRRLMVVALALLIVALGFVLYRDRDFWFPDAEEAEVTDEPAETAPAATTAPPTADAQKTSIPAAKSRRHSTPAKHAVKNSVPGPSIPDRSAPDPDAPETDAAPMTATASRTVLPPLEVEVVAGDKHRTVRPGSNSVNVDLQPGTSPQSAYEAAPSAEGAAGVTNNASERVQMSADTTDAVSHPVKPGYPLLARQMKVQGSVILQALVGKDGAIQALKVISGPPILASAAQAAVRQWRFKPHYSGDEPVETQAKITVNFTISTN